MTTPVLNGVPMTSAHVGRVQVTRDEYLEIRLRRDWWTRTELAEALRLSPDRTWAVLRAFGKRLVTGGSTDRIIARPRHAAKWKPLEYRLLPQAFNVQAVEA